MRAMVGFYAPVLGLFATVASAGAATYRGLAGFPARHTEVKQEAIGKGISARVVNDRGISFDPSIVGEDHGQSVFCRTFEQFSNRMVPPRLGRGRALRQRGDGTVATLRGAWAGKIGQTQFMPSSVLKYAVDSDGNGRRDLVHSVPDALASTANDLRAS